MAVTLLGTLVIVAVGVLLSDSRVGDIGSRLSDTNGRIDAMQQNLVTLIQAETAKLQAGLERVEGVLDARLRHVEEKLSIRLSHLQPETLTCAPAVLFDQRFQTPNNHFVEQSNTTRNFRAILALHLLGWQRSARS
jgi:hypothetical protein